LKSGPEEAADGIPRQSQESDAEQPSPEFPELPADAAICSARQHREPAAVAEKFLRAVATGEDEAVTLATALAEAFLDASGAKLAQSVLDGGPLTITRAIRLAELVLTSRNATAKVGAP
jgi:hypothetical protein